MSHNPYAIDILKENKEIIDYIELHTNGNIYTYNYKLIKKDNKNGTITQNVSINFIKRYHKLYMIYIKIKMNL